MSALFIIQGVRHDMHVHRCIYSILLLGKNEMEKKIAIEHSYFSLAQLLRLNLV